MSSTTFVTVIGTADGLLIVTLKVTSPPGSLIDVGFALLETPIAPAATFSLEFVNVHLTFSPAATTNVAVRVPVLPVEFASSQTIEVRSQPAFAASATVYVPAETLFEAD